MNTKDIRLEVISERAMNELCRYWNVPVNGNNGNDYARIVTPLVFPDYQRALHLFTDNRNSVAAVYRAEKKGKGKSKTSVQELRRNPELLTDLASYLQSGFRNLELQFCEADRGKVTKVVFRGDVKSGAVVSYWVNSPLQGKDLFTWNNGVELQHPRFYGLLRGN